jgi:hypothetical protein
MLTLKLDSLDLPPTAFAESIADMLRRDREWFASAPQM